MMLVASNGLRWGLGCFFGWSFPVEENEKTNKVAVKLFQQVDLFQLRADNRLYFSRLPLEIVKCVDSYKAHFVKTYTSYAEITAKVAKGDFTHVRELLFLYRQGVVPHAQLVIHLEERVRKVVDDHRVQAPIDPRQGDILFTVIEASLRRMQQMAGARVELEKLVKHYATVEASCFEYDHSPCFLALLNSAPDNGAEGQEKVHEVLQDWAENSLQYEGICSLAILNGSNFYDVFKKRGRELSLPDYAVLFRYISRVCCDISCILRHNGRVTQNLYAEFKDSDLFIKSLRLINLLPLLYKKGFLPFYDILKGLVQLLVKLYTDGKKAEAEAVAKIIRETLIVLKTTPLAKTLFTSVLQKHRQEKAHYPDYVEQFVHETLR